MANHFKEDNESESFLYNGKTIYKLGDNKFYDRRITKNNPKGQRFYWKYVPCCECENQTLKQICQISRSNGRVTCGKECSTKIKSGSNHYLWKPITQKKRTNGSTSLKIWMPNHPYAKKGRVHEHRVVMENKIGRILLESEIVHHIDCDAHNNDPSNLALCDSGSSHMLAHGSLNKCVKELLARNMIGFDNDSLEYYIV
jgi:hypothetical protein